jgi:hypothetical protein
MKKYRRVSKEERNEIVVMLNKSKSIREIRNGGGSLVKGLNKSKSICEIMK